MLSTIDSSSVINIHIICEFRQGWIKQRHDILQMLCRTCWALHRRQWQEDPKWLTSKRSWAGLQWNFKSVFSSSVSAPYCVVSEKKIAATRFESLFLVKVKFLDSGETKGNFAPSDASTPYLFRVSRHSYELRITYSSIQLIRDNWLLHK